MARKLGCDVGAADTVELAARLQSLDGVGADELEAIPSLREVGEIVRWHRTGGPLERTPLGAQVLAVTNAYDGLVSSVDGRLDDRRSAIDELTAGAGVHYSPAVVRALAAVVGVKPRSARGRDLPASLWAVAAELTGLTDAEPADAAAIGAGAQTTLGRAAASK